MFATYSYYRVLVVAMTYDDVISLFSILVYFCHGGYYCNSELTMSKDAVQNVPNKILGKVTNFGFPSVFRYRIMIKNASGRGG